jgi:hypothetical protein
MEASYNVSVSFVQYISGLNRIDYKIADKLL